MSGGIRDAETLEAALATGCRRVNLGTAALEDPEWTAGAIAEHGDRVAVGLDVRGTTLAARGWTQEGGDLWETLARLDGEGCARYVVTDVNKDGMLKGPNLDLLREVCARTDRPVVASGGVSTLEDIAGAAHAGRRRGRGRDHRVGALPRRVHAARGPRRGGPAVTSASPARRRLATDQPLRGALRLLPCPAHRRPRAGLRLHVPASTAGAAPRRRRRAGAGRPRHRGGLGGRPRRLRRPTSS